MGSSLAYAAATNANYIDADDPAILFDMGMVCSSGAGGTVVDLIEAHKWFNLAALKGFEDAAAARTEIAAEMSGREIALAQKAARAWLAEVRA